MDEERWIYAYRSCDPHYKHKIQTCGKWLVFVSEHELNNAWRRIRDATECGHLGYVSRTFSAMPNTNNPRLPPKVISIHTTEDNNNIDEILRVLAWLRRLGFAGRLQYKPDNTSGSQALYTSAPGKIELYAPHKKIPVATVPTIEAPCLECGKDVTILKARYQDDLGGLYDSDVLCSECIGEGLCIEECARCSSRLAVDVNRKYPEEPIFCDICLDYCESQ